MEKYNNNFVNDSFLWNYAKDKYGTKKMDMYVTYFQKNWAVHMGCNYGLILWFFDQWAKHIMALVRLKNIGSTFYPEAGQSDLGGDKYHQLPYLSKLSMKV